MRTRVALSILILLTLGGCSITRIARYDEVSDRAATDLQKRMDAFLTKLEADTTRASRRFEANRPFYDDYGVSLRSLRIRAEGIPRNDLTVTQLARIDTSVTVLRELHRSQDSLSTGAIQTHRTLFNTSWKAVITLETAKPKD